MNLGGIQFPVFNPYNKCAYEIYLSGCTNGCKGCHNKELSDFNFGKELDFEDLVSKMKEREDMFDIISITGGDLLCQDDNEAFKFISDLFNIFPDKEYWLFTGKDENELHGWEWLFFDYIKVGRYKEELIQEGFPSSSNQKLLKNKELK